MPRFVANPLVVEAVQYRGIVADLPEVFGQMCSQAEDGAAYLTVIGGARLVQPDDWLVKTVMGIGVMPAGPFEASFSKIVEDEPVGSGASVTFFGGDGAPDKLVWMDHEFVRGTARIVADPSVVAKLRGHPHFKVVDPEPERRSKLTLSQKAT